MAQFKTGEPVAVKTRPVNDEDERTGLYFAYFGGLTGVVDKIYDDGSVCVDIDLESLDAEMRERHLTMQENERKKWIAALSGEARNRLNEKQKQLKMSYKILISEKDLDKNPGGKPGKKPDKPQTTSDATAESANEGPARAPEPVDKAANPPIKEDAPKRLSEADLAAREEEFLKSRQNR